MFIGNQGLTAFPLFPRRSAEHGIGQMKKAALRFSKSPGAVALHRRIKDLIDPRGIMNPGKMLPDE